jgi:hypothetical protein
LPRLYLDNNVYDHMLKGFPAAVRLRHLLEGAHRRKGLVVSMSLENVNEFIPLLDTDVRAFRTAINLLKDMVEWDQPLKPCKYLLLDDIRSFARYGKGTTPFAGPGTAVRRLMKHALKVLRAPSPQDIMEIQQLSHRQKEDAVDFAGGLNETRAPVGEIIRRSGMHFSSFEAMWRYCFRDDGLIRSLLEPHAIEAGKLDQCRQQGLLGMMGIPSIRMAVGHSLSLIYWMTFKSRTASRRDAGDQHHAIYASAVDIFICEDRFLRKLLLPIPDKPVDVLDIQQAVEKIKGLQSFYPRS